MKQQSSDKSTNKNGNRSSKKTGQSNVSRKAQKGRNRSKRHIPWEAVGIIFCGFLLFSIFAMHANSGGFLGIAVRNFFFALFGWMAYPFVYMFLTVSMMILFKIYHRPQIKQHMILAVILMVFVMLMVGLADASLIATYRNESFGNSLLLAIQRGIQVEGTGIMGTLVLYGLVHLLGRTGTAIVLISFTLATIWITTPQTLLGAGRVLKDLLKKVKAGMKERNKRRESHHASSLENTASIKKTPFTQEEKEMGTPQSSSEAVPFQVIAYEPEHSEHRRSEKTATAGDGKKISDDALPETSLEASMAKKLKQSDQKEVLRSFQLPALTLLKGNQQYQPRTDRRQMMAKAKLLEETLESFGVTAKVIKVSQGPTITRYELQPSRGVKVSKIVNLSDDIALNLAASSIRIEAPIPGKAAIGIEIPNDQVAMVDLKELLSSTEYQTLQAPLPFALGRNIAGDPIVFDINKMPHLLVAGATGSGKSVCINTLILSLLFRAKPDEVKLLMIDPKVVELNQYNGIPHLMIPVVTDPKKATGALRWAVTEMEERYQRFAENGVRDIAGFNEKQPEAPLPYIVVIIDELADLMLVAAKEVEDYICRLAQMARAAGIHLIIATQRPSVDVITGIIKANIPSRIAFSVASQVDSRTILDMGGAEKLLGKGDMLFHPIGYSKPVRIQGAFVSDEEVKCVVEYLKSQSGEFEYETDVLDHIEAMPEECYEEEADDLFQEALRIAFDQQQISISMLQRRLKMGYNRAARLIDEMEAKGYVGPNEGTKPRKVISRPQAMEEMKPSSDQ